jgi:hypothetical protein
MEATQSIEHPSSPYSDLVNQTATTSLPRAHKCVTLPPAQVKSEPAQSDAKVNRGQNDALLHPAPRTQNKNKFEFIFNISIYEVRRTKTIIDIHEGIVLAREQLLSLRVNTKRPVNDQQPKLNQHCWCCVLAENQVAKRHLRGATLICCAQS